VEHRLFGSSTYGHDDAGGALIYSASKQGLTKPAAPEVAGLGGERSINAVEL
jgi:hypothetical protein